MIPMHVGDKNTTYLANSQFAAQELMLGSFATIKQPDLCPLG
jgi:hypothetical protein